MPALTNCTASAKVTPTAIDFQMAQSILDRLGYDLDDLSVRYPDTAILADDITHQLFYGSAYNSNTLMGFVWCDNGIYYAVQDSNHATPEQAALDLLAASIVEDCRYKIELERSMAVEYF